MPTDGARKLIIDGEYDMVSRASQDVDALRLAHQTPITPKDARALIATMAARVGITADRLEVRIGKCKRGRGGIRTTYKRVVRMEYTRSDGSVKKLYRRVYDREVLWISLPSIPGQTTATGGWYLRTGLVLHEFAHMVLGHVGSHRLVNAAGHGPLFTWILDGLVAEWKSTLTAREEIAA